MNTKGNKRYEEMQNKIDDAFLELIREHPDSNVTVRELCDRAKIHRTTFYGHYADVYELMESLTVRIYKKILSFFLVKEEGEVHMDGFLKLFELVLEQKVFFSYYLRNRKGDEEPLLILMSFTEETRKAVMKERGYESEKELYYHQIFFCEGLVAMIKYWINTGCRETPEQMMDMIEREYRPQKEAYFQSDL